MDLIIKPTELCNFKCTFCSSPKLSNSKINQLEIHRIEKFLIDNPNTNTIIVNGGDPLMIEPKYYFNLLNVLDKLNMHNTIISFTSNLWDFKNNPNKWLKLFKHPQVSVMTSFNYGDTRRISKNRIFTESDFWEISDMMLELIGYRPDFISVIDYNNIDTAIDNVRLAKKMNVECKLNPVLQTGRAGKFLLKGEIYKIYLDIIEEGLEEWEFNAKQIRYAMQRKHTICPIAFDCENNIRTLHPDGRLFGCGAFSDRNMFELKSDKDKVEYNQKYLKNECLSCQLYIYCNSCAFDVYSIRNNNRIEEHCKAMRNNIEKLKEVNIL